MKKQKPERCDTHLMMCCNYGDAFAGVECFCNRKKGHKGRHKGTVTAESGTYDHPIHYELDIHWDTDDKN